MRATIAARPSSLISRQRQVISLSMERSRSFFECGACGGMGAKPHTRVDIKSERNVKRISPLLSGGATRPDDN